jgi:phosphate transport system substrate-binding protein
MKTSNLKKILTAGIALAGLALTPNLRAQVPVFIEGGSASQSVLLDRATNLFDGGTFTETNNSGGTVSEFVGTSLNPALNGYGVITFDINVANGAVAGLQSLVNQSPGPGDTNIYGVPTVPTFVDSATSPDAVGVPTATLAPGLPTYVVPLIYIKNTNSTDTAGITNLTERQAETLETSSPLGTTFYGGASTNVVYFVGRNNESAVRTEMDLNIYNTQTINTYYTNALGQPVLDTSADPGLSSGGAVSSTVLVLTNAIGEIAVQNLKKGLAAIPYEGVPYSVTNVENGSYPLWWYENYYYIASPNNGAPSTAQQAVINAFYQSVTNATFQSITNPVFTNNFVPIPSLQVTRSYDGGPIAPLPGNFQ